jgi:hypothetical protein
MHVVNPWPWLPRPSRPALERAPTEVAPVCVRKIGRRHVELLHERRPRLLQAARFRPQLGMRMRIRFRGASPCIVSRHRRGVRRTRARRAALGRLGVLHAVAVVRGLGGREGRGHEDAGAGAILQMELARVVAVAVKAFRKPRGVEQLERRRAAVATVGRERGELVLRLACEALQCWLYRHRARQRGKKPGKEARELRIARTSRI